MSTGKFIVFEGIDGSGKSTQASLLAARLEERGRRVHRTAEPTTLETGKALREVLSGKKKKTECEIATMFVSDRIAHNTDAEYGIFALTERGTDVISDRYYYSNLAYQGQSTDYGWVKAMNTKCPMIKRPDVCIYLDLLPAQSLERISARSTAREIYESEEKLTSVRAAFLSAIEDLRADGETILVFDAYKDIEALSDEIFSAIAELFELN